MNNMGWDTAQSSGAAQESVELLYQPTVKDFTSALRARRSVSRAGRRQKWVLCGVFVALVLEVVAVLNGAHPPVFFFIWVVLMGVLIPLTPWLQARQFQRLAEPKGTFRITVTDTGLVLANDNTTTAVNWAAQPRYKETNSEFVMVSADKNALSFTILPKRGAQSPADVDRLRAILDRNLTRL
ncbi:YcxB family protein [Streptomyces sp. NPDC047022]|uniref:YcxB family protein n=1 Tax=Streptomyces sp. NPDC047022 TaxID=3155737 RepID=UPI0033F42DBE